MKAVPTVNYGSNDYELELVAEVTPIVVAEEYQSVNEKKTKESA